MYQLLQDLRHTLRGLVQRPMFTLVVVGTLALGIGATTAIFTLVDAIILSPLPFEAQARLVTVSHSAPSRGIDNAGQCAAWHFTYEDESAAFDALGMFSFGTATILTDDGPEVVQALYSTSGLFRALRLAPVVGRQLTVRDEELEAPNGLLLGQAFWERRYGADPDVIGTTLDLSGVPWEVVGVLPAQIGALGVEPALVLPLRYDQSTLFVGNIGMDAIGRLRDGLTLEQAHADLARVLPNAWERYPGGPVASSSEPRQYAPVVQLLKDELVGSAADSLWLLLAGVGVVLLIACANVASLFLVRSDSRVTEMAVRTAIGASESRIRWEFVRESLVLGLLGGLGGLGLAVVGLRFLVLQGETGLPRLEAVSISPLVLLFTLVVSLGAGVVLGLLPGSRHRRSNVVLDLKQGAQTALGQRERRRTQDALAVAQMALALVLLVASGLTLRSFHHLINVDPGFEDPEQVLALRLFAPASQAPDADAIARLHDQIRQQLAAIPGVDSVGLANSIPMDRANNSNPFYVDGVEPPGGGLAPSRRHKWIGADYFAAMRISLVAGRAFTNDEVDDRFPGAIVSEGLALQYFGSVEEALGQRVAAQPNPVRWHEIVGVARDVREDGMDHDFMPVVYWPQVTLGFWEGSDLDQLQTWRGMGYAIRSDRVGSPDLLQEVRAAIWSVSPTLPLRGVAPLPNLMAESIARASFMSVLLATAAGVALILGIVGVYGVISYGVSQRNRELAMRLALGAQSGEVQRMVLRRGLLLTSVGTGIGLVLAWAVTGMMAFQLHGIARLDPLTYGLVSFGLLAVALLASYIPARRAARVDPMVALRNS